MFDNFEDVCSALLQPRKHMDESVIRDLETYLKLRAAPSQFLDDHPRLKQFLASIHGHNYKDAYDAAFTE